MTAPRLLAGVDSAPSSPTHRNAGASRVLVRAGLFGVWGWRCWEDGVCIAQMRCVSRVGTPQRVKVRLLLI